MQTEDGGDWYGLFSAVSGLALRAAINEMTWSRRQKYGSGHQYIEQRTPFSWKINVYNKAVINVQAESNSEVKGDKNIILSWVFWKEVPCSQHLHNHMKFQNLWKSRFTHFPLGHIV